MTARSFTGRVSRRDALRLAGASGAGLAIAAASPGILRAQDATPDATPVGGDARASAALLQTYPFELPNLAYDLGALEPVTSEETNDIHYNDLHAGYVDGLNTSLQALPDFQSLTLEDILLNIASFPVEEAQSPQGFVAPIQTLVNTDAGGHYNHSLWWDSQSPDGGGEPSGAIADAITASFGDFATLQEAFRLAALGNTGSGWVWLISDAAGAVGLVSTEDQDNPLALGLGYPVFGIDNWEHSYFLDYGPQRGNFIDAWWDIANWDFIGSRYESFLGV